MNKECMKYIKKLKLNHTKEVKRIEKNFKRKLTKHTAAEIIKYEQERKTLKSEYNSKVRKYEYKIQNKMNMLRRENINRNRNLKNTVNKRKELEDKIKIKNSELRSRDEEIKRTKEVLRLKTESERRRRYLLNNIARRLPQNINSNIRFRLHYLLQEPQSR